MVLNQSRMTHLSQKSVQTFTPHPLLIRHYIFFYFNFQLENNCAFPALFLQNPTKHVLMQMYMHQLLCLKTCSDALTCRNCSCLSGAEVRRQRQEHKPYCLDLLCLYVFVSMQNGGLREGSRLVVNQIFVFETLASGSV